MNSHYVVPILSLTWSLAILFSILVYGFIFWIAFYSEKNGMQKRFRHTLAGVLILREIILYYYIIDQGYFTIQDSLPLQLCNISYLFVIIFLIKPNYFLFEFLILLSLATAVQSLITPEMTHGYSHYFLIDFYFSHAAIIFGPLYGYFILRMHPRKGSWLRVFLFANLILCCVYFINLALNSNYIYLMKAPIVNNPMVLRPYPMHLVGFQIFGTLHIVFIYWLTRKYRIQEITD